MTDEQSYRTHKGVTQRKPNRIVTAGNKTLLLKKPTKQIINKYGGTKARA
jgi:hypothetical protein